VPVFHIAMPPVLGQEGATIEAAGSSIVDHVDHEVDSGISLERHVADAGVGDELKRSEDC
jgi:hypothetical protein